MMKKVTVYGTTRLHVEVDPISVLEQVHPIPPHDWIVEKDGKYIQMTEVSAGQHSFEQEVGEVTKEVYEVYKAKEILINFLRKDDK